MVLQGVTVDKGVTVVTQSEVKGVTWCYKVLH